MGHDTHSTPTDKKPTAPFRASFWLVVILVGLFVSAVNFVSVMSQDEEGHGTEHGSAPAHTEKADHGSSQAHGPSKATEVEHQDADPATADTAAQEMHH